MLNLGRVCVKTAGRDANLKCVIIEETDENFVIIDGLTRRKRCNKLHLEPTKDTLNIKKGASHEEVVKAFKSELNIEIAKKTEAKPEVAKPVKTKKGHDKMLTNQKDAGKEEKTEKKTKPAVKKAVKKEAAIEGSEEAEKPKKAPAKKKAVKKEE